jgi:hypothetical protein
MRRACPGESAVEAEGLLEQLARELDKTHPGAAASLREGLAETLTILRLGVPPTLARTFRSTDPIESMIEICREHSKNVKRWRDGPWRCAGAPPGCSKPATSFAASTGAFICRNSAPRWKCTSTGMSAPSARINP